MGLDREAKEDIQRVKEKIYKRTSVHSIRLYNRRGSINRVWGWIIEICRFPLKIFKWDREKLQDS